MIRFEDWRLVWDGAPVAMQFDNGSTALEIRGTLPENPDPSVLYLIREEG